MGRGSDWGISWPFLHRRSCPGSCWISREIRKSPLLGPADQRTVPWRAPKQQCHLQKETCKQNKHQVICLGIITRVRMLYNGRSQAEANFRTSGLVLNGHGPAFWSLSLGYPKMKMEGAGTRKEKVSFLMEGEREPQNGSLSGGWKNARGALTREARRPGGSDQVLFAGGDQAGHRSDRLFLTCNGSEPRREPDVSQPKSRWISIVPV